MVLNSTKKKMLLKKYVLAKKSRFARAPRTSGAILFVVFVSQVTRFILVLD